MSDRGAGRELTSQKARAKGYEVDALRLGCGWSRGDLSRPLAVIESCFGHSHPGSIHLDSVAQKAYEGLLQVGARPAKYFCSDVCDGITQGTEAMSLSLASREVIALAAELHGKSAHADGVLFVSSCDKAIPGHLIAASRLNLPTVFALGGVMSHGASFRTLESVIDARRQLERGEIGQATCDAIYDDGCPTPGACAFMGTACTMQILAEALGLALPGSALCPARSFELLRLAQSSGEALGRLIDEGTRFSDIVTETSIENALTVLAAIGGSTNGLLHLAALATSMGTQFSLRHADEVFAKTPLLCDIKPSGQYPSDLFWQAGGLPRLVDSLADVIDGSAMTITGKTLGQSAHDYLKVRPTTVAEGYLSRFGLSPESIIRPADDPVRRAAPIGILFGNLAPGGAVVKWTGADDRARFFRARVFNGQESALREIVSKRIEPGDAIVIRYEGPKATGMPEQFYATELLAIDESIAEEVAVLTDGRFSGATRGVCVGHISPEAAAEGPIALLEDGDIILIDVGRRRLELVGDSGGKMSEREALSLLERRRASFTRPAAKRHTGLLAIYTSLASSVEQGCLMMPPE